MSDKIDLSNEFERQGLPIEDSAYKRGRRDGLREASEKMQASMKEATPAAFVAAGATGGHAIGYRAGLLRAADKAKERAKRYKDHTRTAFFNFAGDLEREANDAGAGVVPRKDDADNARGPAPAV